MLNERLNRYNEIADKEGLYFVWHQLIEGVTSIDGINKLRLHHIGKLSLNIEAALILFDELKLIEIRDDTILLKSEIKHNTIEAFVEWFSLLYVKFLINEEILLLPGFIYDSQKDKFAIERKCIKMRHACYRNLMLSLGIISIRDSKFFFVEKLLDSIVKSSENRIRKISEEQLLKELEEQRERGKIGEEFVLSYEMRRLSTRQDSSNIKIISQIDVTAGYDIISYNDEMSVSLDRFIEVKTFIGSPHFHWSSNEIQTAKMRSKHYFIYLVDYSRINDKEYTPLVIQDPISFFKDNSSWTFTPDSYLISKI